MNSPRKCSIHTFREHCWLDGVLFLLWLCVWDLDCCHPRQHLSSCFFLDDCHKTNEWEIAQRKCVIVMMRVCAMWANGWKGQIIFDVYLNEMDGVMFVICGCWMNNQLLLATIHTQSNTHTTIQCRATTKSCKPISLWYIPSRPLTTLHWTVHRAAAGFVCVRIGWIFAFFCFANNRG